MLVSVTLACSAVPALAGAWRDEVLKCAGEVDDTARLACFDRALQGHTKGATTAQPMPEADAAEAFGREALPARADEARPAVDSIQTTIAALDRRPRGERVFTLANGQKWTELSAGRARYEEGLMVRIERTSVGGYMLSTQSGRATRVRRLE